MGPEVTAIVLAIMTLIGTWQYEPCDLNPPDGMCWQVEGEWRPRIK